MYSKIDRSRLYVLINILGAHILCEIILHIINTLLLFNSEGQKGQEMFLGQSSEP